MLTEVNTHWSDNLVPSPNKRDLVFQHMKGPGLHSYVEQPNGVNKYVCSPEATCRSHQRHFMKNTTTALYKHFLQMYPLRRGNSFLPASLLFCKCLPIRVLCSEHSCITCMPKVYEIILGFIQTKQSNGTFVLNLFRFTLFIFTTDRYCYLISISEIEAILCLQAFSSVSAFPFAYYFLKIVVLHACQKCMKSFSV